MREAHESDKGKALLAKIDAEKTVKKAPKLDAADQEVVEQEIDSTLPEARPKEAARRYNDPDYDNEEGVFRPQSTVIVGTCCECQQEVDEAMGASCTKCERLLHHFCGGWYTEWVNAGGPLDSTILQCDECDPAKAKRPRLRRRAQNSRSEKVIETLDGPDEDEDEERFCGEENTQESSRKGKERAVSPGSIVDNEGENDEDDEEDDDEDEYDDEDDENDDEEEEGEEEEAGEEDEDYEQGSENEDSDDSGSAEQSDSDSPRTKLASRKKDADPKTFLNENDAKHMASFIQYGEEEAVLRYYLHHDPEKVYSLKDLDDEDTLQLALRLLFAARTGEGRLRSTPSLHIKYDQLHSDSTREAKAQDQKLAQELLDKFVIGYARSQKYFCGIILISKSQR